MFRRLIFLSFLALVFLASALASFRFWVESALDKPLNIEMEKYVLDVQPGSSLNLLARKLSTEGIISSPIPLLLYSRFHAVPHIMVGEYALTKQLTLRDLIEKLVRGDVIRFQITFPEGLTLHQWLEIINGHELFDQSEALTLAELQQNFAAPAGDGLEGWFFPDTYLLSKQDSAMSVFHQAHKQMREVLRQAWDKRDEGLPFDSPYEALILASIIEKETGVPEERPTIAGVFVRRLQTGMRLQTDPTVIYGLGAEYNGNITRRHLRTLTPYNTYLIRGLPPTPIANPGRESILAAVNPADGNELFFVARGDGSHYFSATLAEHRQAVRKYQLQRAGNYRSTPQ